MLNQTVLITYTNGVDHTTLTYSPVSLQAPADGVSMIKFTLTAYDINNVPVSGAFMDCGASNNNDNSIQIFGAGASTDVNGQVKCMFASSVAKISQAYFIDIKNVTVQSKDMTFVTPTGEATKTFTINKSQALPDGNDSIIGTLTIIDSNGVPQTGVHIDCLANPNTDTWVNFYNDVFTDSNGQAQCWLYAITAGVRDFSAYTSPSNYDFKVQIGNTKSVNFTNTPTGGAVSPSVSVVTASPTLLSADGIHLVTVTILLKDDLGNPISGVVPSVSVSGSGNVVTLSPLASDANGSSTMQFNSNVAETKTVTVVANGITLSNQPTIIFTSASNPSLSASNSTVTVDKTSALADGVDAITATITLKNTLNNPISGVQSTCNVTGTNNAVSTPSLTDSNGQAVCVITSTTAESKTISVSAGNSSTLFSDSFELNPLTGWTSASISGTSANWNQTDRTDFGGPQQGTYMMDFNSYYASGGDSARLYSSSGFAFPDAYTPITLSFWMYHETSWNTSRDNVQVQVSTDGGSTWQNVGSPVYRYDGTTQWTQHTVSLSGISGPTSNVLIGFLGTADGGNDEFIDNVQVMASPVILNSKPVVGFVSNTAVVSAVNSTVTVDKTSALADGVDAITALITLLDDSSAPISGVVPTCNVTGSNNVVSTPNLTDASGQTVCVITSTTAEDKTITVTANGTTLNNAPVVTFANAPIITAGPSAATTQTTAIITWSTDQLSDSQVNYGIATSSYSNSSALDSNLVNSHSVTISNLTPYTTYHFQVTSKNSLGLQLLSGDYIFTTNYFGVTMNSLYSPEAISVSQSTDGSYTILGKGGYLSSLGYSVSSTVFKLTSGGILDTSFGTGGSANLNYDPIFIKQLSDGSYVVGSGYDWPMIGKYPATGIIKINSNGSLDSSFGNGGYSPSLMASTGYSPDGQVEQTSDGGYIIAMGYASKILSNGSIDQSFGVNGSSTMLCDGDLGILYVQTPMCASHMPNDIHQLSGGGYVYVGNEYLNSIPGYPYGNRIMIAKFLSDGKTLDASFGINGSSTDLLPSQFGVHSVGSFVQSSDGGYVIGGYNDNYSIFLTKFTSSGQLDAGFGVNGSTTSIGAGTAKSFVRNTSDGGYLLFAGLGKVYKYNSSGSLDTSFGINGVDDLGNTQGSLFTKVDDIRQTLDGGYIAVGTDKSYSHMYILKLNSSGSPTNF